LQVAGQELVQLLHVVDLVGLGRADADVGLGDDGIATSATNSRVSSGDPVTCHAPRHARLFEHLFHLRLALDARHILDFEAQEVEIGAQPGFSL